MQPCESCSRHLMPGTSICPFCTTKRAAQLASAAVMPAVLSACYGQPPCGDSEDVDGDGFSVCLDSGFLPDEDCDDSNPNVSPAQSESCDNDIDDNCDGVVAGTEQSEVCWNDSDDDCDGLVPAEDPDCASNTGDTGETTTTGTVAVSYTFSAPVAIADCEAAGLGEGSLTVTTVIGGTPQTATTVDCDNTVITLTELPAGTQAVSVTGASSDGIRTWDSGTLSVEVVADTSTPLDVVLTCSSTETDGCGVAQ